MRYTFTDTKGNKFTVTRDKICDLLDKPNDEVTDTDIDAFLFERGAEKVDYSFDLYQTETSQTAKYPPDRGLEYLSLGIASEAGEVAGKMKKWIRDVSKLSPTERDAKYPQWRKDMASEIGDVLWYCARLADELEIPLSEIAYGNMSKLLDRKSRGVIGGSGDNR